MELYCYEQMLKARYNTDSPQLLINQFPANTFKTVIRQLKNVSKENQSESLRLLHAIGEIVLMYNSHVHCGRI